MVWFGERDLLSNHFHLHLARDMNRAAVGNVTTRKSPTLNLFFFSSPFRLGEIGLFVLHASIQQKNRETTIRQRPLPTPDPGHRRLRRARRCRRFPSRLLGRQRIFRGVFAPWVRKRVRGHADFGCKFEIARERQFDELGGVAGLRLGDIGAVGAVFCG